MRVDEKVLSCVVFIGKASDGHFTAFGTGFMAVRSTGGRLFQHVVTARHVVESIGDGDVCIRINRLSGGFEHTMADSKDWVFHPDPSVDIAVCPTHVPPEEYAIHHVNLNDELADDDVIDDQMIGVGDEVFMAGMFTRHLGEFENRPIVRTGTIAAMRGEKIETNRGFVDAYLIEARSIAGLSGSPVFVQIAPLRVMPGGEVRAAEGRVFYFLGVMQGHHVTQDPVDVASPDDVYAPGDMNTGIGVVIPCQLVVEAVDVPKLKDERERIAAEANNKSGFVPDSAAKREPPTKAENLQHREDFNRLLDAAVRERKSDDQT